METNPLSEKCVIHHIPEILYSWRMCKTSTASSESSHIVKNYAHGAQKKALEEDLKNRNLLGHVVPTPYLGEWYVNYSISSNPKVSIIIPTKDNYSYLNNCISSILTKTTYKNFEIVIVDTGSTSKRALDYYRELEATRKIKIINFKQEFNFSEACNHGAKASVGDYLLFLNNDTKVISTDWIQSMLQFSQRPSVGAVGALLLYPDRRIQHLGGILGIAPDPNETGIAGHAFKGADYDNFRHFDKYAVKNYSFVTAACLMINKKKFFHIGGFNPEYRIAFNDVDFCLRLLKQNLVNIINPNVTLYHYESVSVGHPTDKSRSRDTWKKELELFIKNWGDIKDKDPYFNINFSRNSENFLIKY